MRETIRKNTVDLRYCRFYPSNYPYQSLALARAGLAEIATTPQGGETEVDAAHIWKMIEHCSQEGMLQKLRDGRLDAWVQDKRPIGSKGPIEVKEPGDIIQAHTKESPLPPQAKLESREEFDESWNDSEEDAYIEGESEGSDSDMEEDLSFEDGDAVVDYSNSEQAIAEQVSHQQDRDEANTERSAHLLRDLSPRELNAQLRYFHTTRKPSDVSQETLVRCLVCAAEGHMAATCDSLTCTACGAYNQHTTRGCPQTTKCSKCREHGHYISKCPYKLNNTAQSEIICDLCQRNGHAETDCELQWRTSGKIWDPSVLRNRVNLSCYECGRAGHLGNDCPTRRPGKSLGTSTWGSGNKFASIKSKRQMSIKGRVTQQEPILLDDSEDEMANFHRPRVPLPARKGQIKVTTAPARESSDLRSRGGGYNDSYGHSSGYRNYRDDDRGRDSRRVENKYTPSYGLNGRRSVSPGYRYYGRDYRSDRYPQPPPQPSYQPQRPSANANVYRPMPSSAQNAWSRHLV